jgi:hypothetical protein
MNKNTKHYLILALLIAILSFVYSCVLNNKNENFSGTGSIIQLQAKDQQDLHLSDTYYAYPHPYMYGYLPNMVWNNNTRQTLPRLSHYDYVLGHPYFNKYQLYYPHPY